MLANGRRDERLSDENVQRESFDDDEEEGEESMSELSSSPSIPEGEIDFNFVYALHTFMATVEGQATSQKGDTLVLLDDTNSYWWLVRNIKDDSIGYLPAEHIETPPERLARLNKHRNVDNGAAQMIDMNPSTGKTGGSRKFSLRKSRKPAVTFSSPKVIQYEVLDSESEPEEGAEEAAPECEVSAGPMDASMEATPASVSSPTTIRNSLEDAQGQQVINGDTAAVAATSPRSHTHKNSQGSFQSETNSSVHTNEESEQKEGTKKKKGGVFGGLFKKRSKREKSSEATVVESKLAKDTAETKDSRVAHIAPLQTRVNTSELPDAVKEMRSSVMMETDPVSVDMVEEPHSRGPVDEVEMLHAQRSKGTHTPRETQHEQSLSEKESFVWTDRAVEAYLEAEQTMHKRLLVLVQQQAKSERTKNINRLQREDHTFDALQDTMNQAFKKLDSLLLGLG